jgi:hypothetical protein
VADHEAVHRPMDTWRKSHLANDSVNPHPPRCAARNRRFTRGADKSSLQAFADHRARRRDAACHSTRADASPSLRTDEVDDPPVASCKALTSWRTPTPKQIRLGDRPGDDVRRLRLDGMCVTHTDDLQGILARRPGTWFSSTCAKRHGRCGARSADQRVRRALAGSRSNLLVECVSCEPAPSRMA